MPIWRTTDPTPTSNALTEQIYNALDCCLTTEVFGVLEKQLDEVTSKVYELERALQVPVFEMELRGVRVDITARDDLILKLSKDVSDLEISLSEILREGIGVEINPASPKQLGELLYDILGLPEVKSFKTHTRTVDRKALEKLKHYFYAAPIVNHILVIRDLSKQISTLRTSIDNDNRIRTSFNIAGTDTGRFSSYASALGSGCVLPSAEVLTKTGWKRIDSIEEGTVIAQWDKEDISFVPCKIFKKTFSGNMLKLSSSQTCLTVTPAHRVAYRTSNYRELHTKAAAYVKTLGDTKIPLGGYNQDGYLSYPSYLSMLMADFSKEPTGWRGAFKKERKIKRFLALAEEFGFSYTEQNKPDYRRFYVSGQLHLPKKWGEWVLSLTRECAENLLEEARHWDAHDRGSGFIFYTADKEQAEWFATLAHIAGKSATIRSALSTEKAYAITFMWSVNVKDRRHATVYRKHWTEVPYEGDIYCPIVPSTFWLVRENNFISVTGNTNLQNIDPQLRQIFCADPGYRMAYIDLEQAESRGVGAIEWNLFNDGTYLDACESGDLHTAVAVMCWPHLAWPDDPKGRKALAKSIILHRQDDLRQGSKKLGHASNYFGKPPEIAKQTNIPFELVKDFQPRYFKAFPSHQRWHAWVQSKLLKDGFITTFMGRRRTFFGRRWDSDTIKSAIAYEPQSSIADYLSRGILRVKESGLCQLLLQVHDAILIQYPEEQENDIIPRIQKLLEIEVPLLHGRTLVIPTEAQVGWNWAYYDEKKNPNGLKGFTGEDKRKRVIEQSFLDRKFSEA